MKPIRPEEVGQLDQWGFHEHLAPIYETVKRLRRELPIETTLIGFCGAPWTLATYMIAGHGTPDQAPARLFGYRYPEAMDRLLTVLADCSADYLARQVEAGADVLQIFDSWAGVLDEASFERFCVQPVARMVERLRRLHPDVPVIGFPRAAGSLYAGYRRRTGVTALGLDWTVSAAQARVLQEEGPVQGNLDPQRVVAGGGALREGVANVLDVLGRGPLIFNLGHGITPDAPTEHVAELVELVRSARL